MHFCSPKLALQDYRRSCNDNQWPFEGFTSLGGYGIITSKVTKFRRIIKTCWNSLLVHGRGRIYLDFEVEWLKRVNQEATKTQHFLSIRCRPAEAKLFLQSQFLFNKNYIQLKSGVAFDIHSFVMVIRHSWVLI